MTDASISIEPILPLIHTMREQRVILGADLAALYGVQTKRLNEQVRRNAKKLPSDFAFQLSAAEAATQQGSRSQIATLMRGSNIKYLPYAFPKHGALMAANVLNSLRQWQ